MSLVATTPICNASNAIVNNAVVGRGNPFGCRPVASLRPGGRRACPGLRLKAMAPGATAQVTNTRLLPVPPAHWRVPCVTERT